MAVLAGNAADIYIATGSGTAMTGEAVTSLGGGVYQITDTAKRAINPNAAVTVLDGVSTVPKANYQIGWASGKITLTNGYTAGGTITITAEYLTLAQAAQARGRIGGKAWNSHARSSND
jgi:gamma-glutamyltranspeptidase